MTVLRIFALSAACLALASCDTTKNGGSSGDPYASNYGNDGHYNPYPGQSGYTNPTPSTPTYQTPPAPISDPYAFGNTTPAPSPSYTKPKATTSSKPKSVASSSTKKKSSSGAKSTSKKSSGSRYAVTKGDTLYGIARKKGTTVAKIKAANGLSGDIIRPGQSLKIP